MEAANPELTQTLKEARRVRRLSQLELSLRLGVSQRHVSFVESGRSKPSRALLLAWLDELGAPLAARNQALLEAGFAPAYSAASLQDSSLSLARQALEQLLRGHDPMPAYVLDNLWNVVDLNRGARRLFAAVLPWAEAAARQGQPMNMLDVLLHPDGVTRAMVNLHEVGPHLLAQLRQEQLATPALIPKVQAFADLLRKRLGEAATVPCGVANFGPMLTSRLRISAGELVFFSMFTTFGSPHDITLSSLRVEQLFAADEATRSVLAGLPDPGL